jgi:hypothetical protein
MIGERFRRLQERFADPLLTTLTIMVAMLLFVVAPLQVAGAIAHGIDESSDAACRWQHVVEQLDTFAMKL